MFIDASTEQRALSALPGALSGAMRAIGQSARSDRRGQSQSDPGARSASVGAPHGSNRLQHRTHFAQTMASFRDTVERRARSVICEFELAVRGMAARPRLRHPIEPASQGDWREAVTHVARGLGERRPAAVSSTRPTPSFNIPATTYSTSSSLTTILRSMESDATHRSSTASVRDSSTIRTQP